MSFLWPLLCPFEGGWTPSLAAQDLARGWTLRAVGSLSSFGSAASTALDVNGDGYSDVIVEAQSYGSSNTGAEYVYYGNPATAA